MPKALQSTTRPNQPPFTSHLHLVLNSIRSHIYFIYFTIISGFLDSSELFSAMRWLGISCSPADVYTFIKYHDSAGGSAKDCQIDYQEFISSLGLHEEVLSLCNRLFVLFFFNYLFFGSWRCWVSGCRCISTEQPY